MLKESVEYYIIRIIFLIIGHEYAIFQDIIFYILRVLNLLCRLICYFKVLYNYIK